MARIRTIKPAFWESELLGSCSTLARLTFAGLISISDDEGRGHGNPRFLYGHLHPYALDISMDAFVGALAELARVPADPDQKPLVVFYAVAGSTFYCLPGFLGPNGQRIDHPTPSKLPAPPKNASKDCLLPGINLAALANPREAAREITLDRIGQGEDRTRNTDPGAERPAAAPAPGATAGPIAMTFPVVGKGAKEWPLTEAKLAEYVASYPAVDVRAECRSLRQWAIDNPSKRKTIGGMPAFLSRNLGRKQDEGGTKGRPGGAGGSPCPLCQANPLPPNAVVCQTCGPRCRRCNVQTAKLFIVRRADGTLTAICGGCKK